MARIDYVDEEDVSDEVREMLLDYKEEHGERSMMRESLANHPPLLEAITVCFDNLMRTGTLDRELKEVIAVVVSQTNECDYCAASHRESLVEVVGLPTDRFDAIKAEEFEELPERYRAAAEFAQQVAANPNRVTDDHFETLRDAGFTDQNIVELLGVVGLFMFVNTYGIALNMRASDRDETLPTY